MTIWDDICEKRKATPCYFLDGIPYDLFEEIAHASATEFDRITQVSVNGPVIYCTVESQRGYSEWDFAVDFNNWGHITGCYWTYTDNDDSSIPGRYGNLVSGVINSLLNQLNISLIDYDHYVRTNDNLEAFSRFICWEQDNLFKKLLVRKKYVIAEVGSCNLLGEHLYPVFAIMQSCGFRKIVSAPLEDVGPNASRYIYEVEKVSINGISDFDIGDSFSENATVVIYYHTKQTILAPSDMRSFRKKNYIDVGDCLQNLGFSNIYERKIRDLTTGWMTKDGAVEQILIRINGEEMPMQGGKKYEYDTDIIITYHTF